MRFLLLISFLFGAGANALSAAMCGPATQDYKRQYRCTKLDADDGHFLYVKLMPDNTVVAGVFPVFKIYTPSKAYVPHQVERQSAKLFFNLDGDTIAVQEVLFYGQRGYGGKVELKNCEGKWVGTCTEED